MMKPGSLVVLLCLLLGQAGARADVTASVDRSVITEQDSLTLTLTATAGEDMDSVDFSALEAYFNIASRDRQSQFRLINGRAEGNTVLSLTLFPLHTGNLEIPPLFVDGTLTPRIPIRVEKARSDIDAATEVFVETEVDREQVYVQAQLLLTIRSYQAVNTGQWNYEPVEIPGAVTEELDTRQYQRSVEGRPYLVIERRYAIFPQQSGELLIPSFAMAVKENLRSGSSFFNLRGNPRIFRPRTRELTVDVLPIPPQFPDAHWLPARGISLEDNWSLEPEALEIGGSATRTLTIKALGLNGNQLPQLPIPETDGLKAYPDQPRHENLSTDEGITGLGINSTALLVTGAGDFELPALRVPWWDTEADQLRYAEVPARSFTIEPRVLASPASQAALPAQMGEALAGSETGSSSTEEPVWFWATMIALTGWLLTTVVLLMRPRAARPESQQDGEDQASEARLFKELIQACNENRATDARTLLRQWAQVKLQRRQAPAISELVRLADEPGLAESLVALEYALYAGDPGQWRGGELMSGLRQWRKQLESRERDRGETPLPPLYG